MAKSPKDSPAPVPPSAPSITLQSISALPAQLPTLLQPLLNDQWQLIAIVPCRDSNDHVAYLTRTL